MKKAGPIKTVEAYIAAAPKETRGTLKQLRKTIKTAAPKTKEAISYHIPYYNYHGRLAYFAAYKKHCSFFWISTSDMKTYKKDLATLKVVGHTLRIPLGNSVPSAFIKKIVRARAKENEKRRKESRYSRK